MKKSKRNKKVPTVLEASTPEHVCHLPNKMHLQACIEGARVQRNRKKYTRKGKDRFDARKFEYWFGFFLCLFVVLQKFPLLLQTVPLVQLWQLETCSEIFDFATNSSLNEAMISKEHVAECFSATNFSFQMQKM